MIRDRCEANVTNRPVAYFGISLSCLWFLMSSFYSQKVFHSLPKMKRKRNSRLVEIKHSVAMGCSKAKPTIIVNGLANSLPAPGRDPAFVFLLKVIAWKTLELTFLICRHTGKTHSCPTET